MVSLVTAVVVSGELVVVLGGVFALLGLGRCGRGCRICVDDSLRCELGTCGCNGIVGDSSGSVRGARSTSSTSRSVCIIGAGRCGRGCRICVDDSLRCELGTCACNGIVGYSSGSVRGTRSSTSRSVCTIGAGAAVVVAGYAWMIA